MYKSWQVGKEQVLVLSGYGCALPGVAGMLAGAKTTTITYADAHSSPAEEAAQPPDTVDPSAIWPSIIPQPDCVNFIEFSHPINYQQEVKEYD